MASTERCRRAPEPRDLAEIGVVAADMLGRAIARGVFEAVALAVPGALPSWRDAFAERRWRHSAFIANTALSRKLRNDLSSPQFLLRFSTIASAA